MLIAIIVYVVLSVITVIVLLSVATLYVVLSVITVFVVLTVITVYVVLSVCPSRLRCPRLWLQTIAGKSTCGGSMAFPWEAHRKGGNYDGV